MPLGVIYNGISADQGAINSEGRAIACGISVLAALGTMTSGSR